MFPNNHKKYHYPWRPDGKFTLLIDGSQFYPRMLDAIKNATNFICLEMYLMESGNMANQFIDALLQAQQRNIKIYILLDDYGSQDLSNNDRNRLIQAGIQTHFFNPFQFRRLFTTLQRDHRKLLLVDGELAFVGGAGITDEFHSATQPAQSWHETMVMVEGPVVQDWLDLFSHTWLKSSGSPSNLPVIIAPPNKAGHIGRVSIAEGFGRQEINRSLIKRCRTASQRVWISTPYFLISRKLRHVLRRLARQGIDVRIMVPGSISDHPWVTNASRRYYTRLLRQGVRIFEYQPRFLHSKIQLCDNWVSIGSSNLDRWNQNWNLDANQEIDNPQFVAEVESLFESDFRHCHEIQFSEWKTRPFRQHIKEWFCGRFVYLLERVSRKLQKHGQKKTG